MNKKLAFNLDIELEITCSVTRAYPGRGPSMEHAGGEPAEPSEIEDLYVGAIIRGAAIDITSLLSPRQIEAIEEECFLNLEENS